MKIKKLFFEAILSLIFLVILENILFPTTLVPFLDFFNSILPKTIQNLSFGMLYFGNLALLFFPLIAYLIFKYSMKFENENKINLIKPISLAFLIFLNTVFRVTPEEKIIKAVSIITVGIIITFIYMFRKDNQRLE